MENDYYKRYEPFFGSWYIKRFIGKGSYGKVFEVERKDAFGTVYTGALKAITVPTSEDELEDLLANGMDRDSASTYFRNYAEGLNREIALMSRLKGHSNIVSYEDHDIQPHEDGMGWDMLIRMELLTPITIFQKANKPFTRRQVIQLGIDLCRALEVCQKYNIIHRDIKPANIFLSETGDFKLGDFGVARIASATTGASTRAGTVNYMAPEVFRGEKYTSNVDIYSLGLVMYQLLNANRMPLCPPYPQLMTPEQWEQANARRLAGTALPPPANADGRLAEIVLKACSPNSAERYEAPSLMRQALEAILYTEQETKDIYPEGDALPLPKTSEKNPPVPQPGTDRETENVWVKMREAGGESALAEPLPVTETLTEKVPTKHELESECEKVPETAPDETENKTQYLFKAQEEARRKAEEARRAAEEAARQAEFERREQELAWKREETRQRAKANVEATREAEENASKVEVPVRPSKKKPTRGLKHVWIDVVGAVGIGAVLLIMGYNFFLGGMFTKKEEPASSEESSAVASASSKADSAVVVELPAAASMSESESASSEEPASTNIPESSSVSSSSVTVSSGSAVSSSSVAVASGSTAPTAAGNSTAQVAASASTEPTTDSTIQMVTNQTYQIWGTYTGEWENDAPSGLGKINFFNGDVYEGQWKDGIMSGQGKYTYANGDVYEGDFQNSSKSGQGKYSYANGSAYEGQWKNDLRDGWGVMKASDGTVYEGEWKSGKTSGQGKMTFLTGDVYEGSFQNGHISGQGTMTYSDGTIKSGTWKNDEFVG